MNIEEKMTAFAKILDIASIVKVIGIREENHKPDVFTVSPKHMKLAKETNDGVLTEVILETHRCRTCKSMYSKHTSDQTLILQLRRDTYTSEATAELVKIKNLLEELDVQQVAFADSEEQFKFIQDGTEKGNIDASPSKNIS